MSKVHFKGWEKGARKIRFTMLLYDNSDMSLAEAKSIKDRVMKSPDKKVDVVVGFSSKALADYIIEHSRKIGVICQHLDDIND